MHLVGASGEIVEELGNILGLPTCLFEHLAGVDCLGAAEFLRFIGQEFRQLAQIAAAFGGGGVGPWAFAEGVVRRLDGPVDIACRCLRNLRPHLAGRRIEALEGLAVLGINPFPVDIHLIARQTHW